MTDLEHPDITRARRTGEGTRTRKATTCPVCGEDIDSDTVMYVTDNFEPVGCENCITRIGAWQYFKQ